MIVSETAGTRSRSRGSVERYASVTHQLLRTLRLRIRFATVAGRRPSGRSAAHARPASSVKSAKVCTAAADSSEARKLRIPSRYEEVVLGDRLRARQSTRNVATTSSSRRRRGGSRITPADQVHARSRRIRCTRWCGIRVTKPRSVPPSGGPVTLDRVARALGVVVWNAQPTTGSRGWLARKDSNLRSPDPESVYRNQAREPPFERAAGLSRPPNRGESGAQPEMNQMLIPKTERVCCPNWATLILQRGAGWLNGATPAVPGDARGTRSIAPADPARSPNDGRRAGPFRGGSPRVEARADSVRRGP